MPILSLRTHGRRYAAALGVVLLASILGQAQPPSVLTIDQLQQMTGCQLGELFAQAEMGAPIVGCAEGRAIYMETPRFAKLKMKLSNFVWRGKMAREDGYFINRWIGGVQALHSQYTIGPSWVDGKPAIIMEYPPKTPLFGNLRDELREVAPGLYMGPVYDRCPCPKFRGYLALQVDPCRDPNNQCRRCREGSGQ